MALASLLFHFSVSAHRKAAKVELAVYQLHIFSRCRLLGVLSCKTFSSVCCFQGSRVKKVVNRHRTIACDEEEML